MSLFQSISASSPSLIRFLSQPSFSSIHKKKTTSPTSPTSQTSPINTASLKPQVVLCDKFPLETLGCLMNVEVVEEITQNIPLVIGKTVEQQQYGVVVRRSSRIQQLRQNPRPLTYSQIYFVIPRRQPSLRPRQQSQQSHLMQHQQPPPPPELKLQNIIRVSLKKQKQPPKETKKTIQQTVEENENCPICYETTSCIETQCHHSFCSCLLQYIVAKNNKNETAPCPLCRTQIKSLQFQHKMQYDLLRNVSPAPFRVV